MFELADLRIPPLDELSFAHPWFFISLIIIPLAIVWYVFKGKNNKPDLTVSNSVFFKSGKHSTLVKLIHLPFILRILSLTLLIIAIARPQTKLAWQDMSSQGIDIVMAMDLSPSMLARDFKPNRL